VTAVKGAEGLVGAGPVGADDGAGERAELGLPVPTLRRNPWFLVALHLPFVASGPALALARHDVPPLGVVLTLLAAAAVGGLQLRHSFAMARGERPAGAVVTFLALAVLVYLPLWWFTWDWATMQWFVIASGAMVFGGGPRTQPTGRWPAVAAVVVAGPIVGQTAVTAWLAHDDPSVGLGLFTAVTVYQFSLLAMGSAALYGSAWLGRVLDDLSAARTELAELAVGRERVRVSRDLHDLLGQTLSAVSLKGDLALRLLATDTAAAGAEIASLTGVARDALRDVRAVARDEHGVALAAELDAAVALLHAAGIVTEVDVDLPPISRPVEEVLAWAVREGATNALRHSGADRWTVSARASVAGDRLTLDIVNDGVATPATPATSATPATPATPAATATLPSGDDDHDGGGVATPAMPVTTAALSSGDGGGGGDGGGDGGSGTGLPGLVERARSVSGTATAGPLDGGRFRLRVEIPLEAT
jgi:two-component system sensor histidine kinase DesK